MKRKPKPPTSAWWCPSCGRVTENCWRHKACGAMDCNGTHGTKLVRMDLVPRGSAKVVLAAIAVHEQDVERVETPADVALDNAVAAMRKR